MVQFCPTPLSDLAGLWIITIAVQFHDWSPNWRVRYECQKRLKVKRALDKADG